MAQSEKLSGAALYTLMQRMQRKGLTLIIRRSFHEWGERSVVAPPLRMTGARWIAVGSDVKLGPGCWLDVVNIEDRRGPLLRIGNGCSFSGNCTISAFHEVILGNNVLLARGVHIGDHDHAFEDTSTPVMEQGVTNLGTVRIDDGAWLGHGAVITSGVHVGRGAVIAAGSVVTSDVPAYSLAVGAPARVIRAWGQVRSS